MQYICIYTLVSVRSKHANETNGMTSAQWFNVGE